MNKTTNVAIDSLIEAISHRLAVLTRQAGIRKKELAERAGVNPNTITALLSGSDMKLSTLIRVSRVLGDTEWLEPLIREPTVTPMQSLQQATRRAGTASGKTQRPASRPMGRQG